jgi:DNA-binding transcriptional regulator YhcF (GntR family)
VYYVANTLVRRWFGLEFNNRVPIYLQVIDIIKKRIVTGQIEPGSKLPSTRALAVEYNINPNTAARIYKEMERMGICYTKRGLGTFVTDSEKIIRPIKYDMAKKLIKSFTEEMQQLGFTKEQMIEEISKEEGK